MTDLDGAPIGQLTSGAPAPSLDNVGIGIGYIAGVREGDEVLVQASPRKAVRALVVDRPSSEAYASRPSMASSHAARMLWHPSCVFGRVSPRAL